ncbi:hypothetical protein ACTJNK_29140 [Achromobacter anxifer]
MSKINLPELPPEVDTVRALFRGQPDHFEAQDYYYTQEQMRAYAEQAVREALAAQEPVAWMTEDGRVSTDVTKRTAMPTASQVVFSIPLALIPENDHGEST